MENKPAKVDLERKVYELREVWGAEDIDKVLLWCFKYAEVEMSYLQVRGPKNLARLARERTIETVDQLTDLTKLAREESSKKLKRQVEYSELKEVLENIGIQMRFLCGNNYEALIHKRYYGDKARARIGEAFE